MSMFFSRDTRVLLKQTASNGTDTNLWEIPVLDGFSFSQSTNSSEITLNEAIAAEGGKSRRARQIFNDSLAPAEWSFSTYIRPIQSEVDLNEGWSDNGENADIHAVEEALWANFVSNNSWKAPVTITKTFASGGASGATTVTLNNVSGLVVGMGVTGTGIANNSNITAISGSEITLDEATTGQVSGTLTFKGDGQWNTGVTNNTSNCLIDFKNSEVAELGTFDLFFLLGGNGISFTKTFASGGASGATTVVLNNATDLTVGMTVAGTGIVTGSKVTAINSSTITLDTATTEQVSGSIVFRSERQVYKLSDCVVNEAAIEFDVDGIATINWSGFSSLITDQGTSGATATNVIKEQITSTDNFIRNRLTTLAVTASDTTTFPGVNNDGVYNVTLTGGSLTFSNSITYLTPEDLGRVNVPLGHIAGTRVVGGNISCYLNDSTGGSSDLFKALIEATSTTVNSFNFVFNIGGNVSGEPRVIVTMPRCHLEIPTHSIEDAISLETEFHALPAGVNVGNTASNYEAKVQYKAA